MEKETKIVLTMIGINVSIIIPLFTLGIILASIIWGIELVNIFILMYFEQQKYNSIFRRELERIESKER